MTIFKFTIEATRERFMEPPLREVHEHYIAADSYDQAHTYVWERLRRGGWEVQRISGHQILLQDIRRPVSDPEDKQLICDLLLPALQATRGLSDLVSLEYKCADDGDEHVIATFDSGYKKRANVTMDSGTAMIYDIMKQIT